MIHPAGLIIDEVQDFDGGGEGAMAFLRGALQEAPNVATVLSGSIVQTVLRLLDPQQPFHGWQTYEIGPIDPDFLARWIQDRMGTHGVDVPLEFAEELVARAGPVSNYRMRLAKACFESLHLRQSFDPSALEAAFDEIVRDDDGSFEQIWRGLSTGQQKALRAVAAQVTHITGKATLDRYGISAGLMGASLQALREKGILPGEELRFSNPFFQEWVARLP